MSNRVSSQGRPPVNALGRSSQILSNVIPANATLQLPCSGTTFYVLAATGSFSIKPSGGSFSSFDVGTGLALPEINAFSNLSIKNDTANPIVFSIFVGFDGFIDNRVIISQFNAAQVAYPTCPKAGVATVINITDKSGTKFADVNGVEWYAISREGIYVFNTDGGVDLLLQKADTTTSNDNAVGAIYSKTTLRFGVSGNYRISTGGGAINAIVSEIYNSIPASAIPT